MGMKAKTFTQACYLWASVSFPVCVPECEIREVLAQAGAPQTLGSSLQWEFLGSGSCSGTDHIHSGQPVLGLPHRPRTKETKVISALGDWDTLSNRAVLRAFEPWNFSSLTVISVTAVRVLRSILCFRINICWHFQNEFLLYPKICTLQESWNIRVSSLLLSLCPEEFWSTLPQFFVPSLVFGALQDGEIRFHAAAGSLWSYKMA